MESTPAAKAGGLMMIASSTDKLRQAHDLMNQQTQSVKVVFGKQYEAISRRCAPEMPYQLGSFCFDSDAKDPHWPILNEPNREVLHTLVPRQRRMLMVGEPSPLCHWPVDYINQFGMLLSPYTINGFEGQWIQSHPALPWIVGWNRETDSVLPLSQLESLAIPQIRDAVSVVVSRKVVHASHRERLQFLDKLKSKLGERLQIFGRGIREVDDKLDAVLPYKYHLALENTSDVIAPISKPRLTKRFKREAQRIVHQATTAVPKVA